jgi:hypothetical protein
MIHASLGGVAQFMDQHIKDTCGVSQSGADENFKVAVT